LDHLTLNLHDEEYFPLNSIQSIKQYALDKLFVGFLSESEYYGCIGLINRSTKVSKIIKEFKDSKFVIELALVS